MCIQVAAVAEVVGGQQVKVVHDLDDIGSADFAHLVLLFIEICDFLINAAPSLADQVHVSDPVEIAAHITEAHDQRFDLLIAKNTPSTTKISILSTGMRLRPGARADHGLGVDGEGSVEGANSSGLDWLGNGGEADVQHRVTRENGANRVRGSRGFSVREPCS